MKPLAIAAAALTLPLAGATAGPLTQDPCPGGQTTPVLFAQLGNDVLENLAFIEDAAHSVHLLVSNSTDGAVQRVSQTGTVTDVVKVASPGAMLPTDETIWEPYGEVLLNTGNALANAVQRNGQAKVVAFNLAGGIPTTLVDGLNMANGMAMLPDETIVTSNDLDRELTHITEPGHKQGFADVYGTNGLVAYKGGLFAAITFDQRSPIARIDIATRQVTTAAQLTFGALDLEPNIHTNGDPDRPLLGVKGLDDMTLGSDQMLYVTANGTGEVLRVDPITGDACLIASGLQNPSSVRIAPEASTFADGDDDTVDLYITEFSGAIRRVVTPPSAT